MRAARGLLPRGMGVPQRAPLPARPVLARFLCTSGSSGGRGLKHPSRSARGTQQPGSGGTTKQLPYESREWPDIEANPTLPTADRKLILRNLPEGVRVVDLQAALSGCGELESCELLQDPHGRWSAFVSLANQADFENVAGMDELSVFGLRVQTPLERKGKLCRVRLASGERTLYLSGLPINALKYR